MDNTVALGLIQKEIVKLMKSLSIDIRDYFLANHYATDSTIWFEYPDVNGCVIHVVVSSYDQVLTQTPTINPNAVIVNFSIQFPDGMLHNVIKYTKEGINNLQPHYTILLGMGANFINSTKILEAFREATTSTTSAAIPLTINNLLRE